MNARTKTLIVLVAVGGFTLPYLMGGNTPTTLTKPFYYYMAPTTTNVLIKPPKNVYTYSLLRDGGTDTVIVWYRGPADSIGYKIPPNAGGERVVSFTIGPPITSQYGVRVTSSTSTSLVISGGY